MDLLRCESEENINGAGGGKVHSTVVYGEFRSFDPPSAKLLIKMIIRYLVDT